MPITLSILLGYCDGDRFIDAQLRSIVCPPGLDCRILIGNDGGRPPAVDPAAYPHLDIRIVRGPGLGPAANHYALAAQAPASDYYAFCDQDDVWLPDKLPRAIRALQNIPAGTPGMFCSATTLIDASGNPIGLSKLPKKPPSFANALVECIAGANTMVFNAAALDRLLAAGPEMPPFSHDWRLYLTTTACGGSIVFDPKPTVLYRQHDANLMGGNRGPAARLKRAMALLDGRYGAWLDSQLHAMFALGDSVPEDSRHRVKLLAQACNAATTMERLRFLRASGVRRQTLSDQLGLYFATLLGRLRSRDT